MKKLKSVPIKRLLREVQIFREGFGGSGATLFSKTVAKYYNKKLKKQERLPIEISEDEE